MSALHHSFTYPVAKLLISLKENREQHIAKYNEAMTNYRNLLKEELRNLCKLADEGGEVNHHISLRKPENHIREYDQAITMLQMTSDTQIEIDGQTFAKLVMDEWEWQHSFNSNTAVYSSASLSRPGAYSSVRI